MHWLHSKPLSIDREAISAGTESTSEEGIPPLPGEPASETMRVEPQRRKAYVGQPAPAELNFSSIIDSSPAPPEVNFLPAFQHSLRSF